MKRPLDTLFLCLLLYFFGVSASVEFGFSNSPPSLYSLYFQLLLLALAGGYAYLWRRLPVSESAFSWKNEWFFIFALVAVYLFSRFIEWEGMPVWLDEYTQYKSSIYPYRGKSIAGFAATEQQPPLDYYLGAFWGHLVGYQVWAIKLHPFVFSLFLSITLYISAVILTGQKWMGLLTTPGSLFFSLFFYYSLEARPLALCLLAAAFVLHFFLLYLQTRKNDVLARLLVAEILFVHTAGFQPEIFLIVLALSSLPLLYWKEWRSSLWKILAVKFLTMISFLPALWKILSASYARNQFLDSSTESYWSRLPSLEIENLIHVYRPLPSLFAILAVIAVLVLGLHLRKTFRGEKKEVNQSLLPIGILLLFLGIFPLVFSSIFHFVINWAIAEKYYIVFYLIPILLLVLLVKRVSDLFFPSYPERCLLFFFFLLASGQMIDRSERFLPQTQVMSRQGYVAWDKVYHHLQERLRPGDQVFLFDFHGFGDWRPDIFVAHEFYLKEELHSHLQISENVNAGAIPVLGERVATPTRGKKFVILQWHRNNDEIRSYLLESTRNFQREKVSWTLVLEFHDRPNETIVALFQDIIEAFPRHEGLSQAYEVLIQWAHLSGRKELSLKYLKELAELHLDDSLSIEGSKVDKKNLLRKKIRFYREWMNQADP